MTERCKVSDASSVILAVAQQELPQSQVTARIRSFVDVAYSWFRATPVSQVGHNVAIHEKGQSSGLHLRAGFSGSETFLDSGGGLRDPNVLAAMVRIRQPGNDKLHAPDCLRGLRAGGIAPQGRRVVADARRCAAAVLLTMCLIPMVLVANAAEQPDFTGVWTVAASGPSGGSGASAAVGRGAGAGTLPFTPYGKARRDAYLKLTNGTDESPGNSCVGAGMPGSMQGVAGYPMEIFQRPEQIYIVLELHSEIRRIYFGSRNAPEEDRIPSRSGYSEGRWEGDTLVVTTNNLVDQVDQATAHSGEAIIVERFKLEGNNGQARRVLVIEMTLTDPRFYSQPVVITKRWNEVPNGRLLPYECTAEMWYQRIEDLANKAGIPVP